ncbi:holin-like protein [Listeria grayi]|uniref:Holin-like protein n=1 Tax=Listeria grayi FSL F6-1183 TaxID=1265827 RepID=A0A829R6A5_LISGR|nr:CidA/LrgA family protein [Listeria grayi]EUJ28557.1 hypothetical protein LMUR_05612 [Listeria grayi FSL F6-1183]VEI30466.1 holin-like protein [Listeria grayi]
MIKKYQATFLLGVKMVAQFAILIIFYELGNGVQWLTHISIPGSLIGLILLFVCLCLRIIPAHWVGSGSSFLLSVMPILFVPVVVGLINYGPLFLHHGIFILLELIISSMIIFFTAGWFTQLAVKFFYKRNHGKEGLK